MERLIHDISDTAKWVAVFRADESDRPDAVFRDPYARRLSGERGEEIANSIRFSKENSWSFVARTYSFDEIIREHVELGFDMIVNLAAGLDTRPYRLQLPSTLQWIEVDLPDILAYKEKILEGEKPKCQFQRIKQDLSDATARKELFKTLGEKCNSALIVSEGLLSYLNDEAVGELAKDLSEQKSFKRWVLDLMSPGLLDLIRREMGYHLEQANVPLKFAPSEGEGFFHQYGWKSLESKSFLKTAATLNRLPDNLLNFASMPEPEGPKGDLPWSAVCLFENLNAA